jgi:hypothetical protein
MEYLKKPVDNFSAALNEALRNRYSKVPSAAFFMDEFNSRAYGTKTINRETARKWIKGLALPKASAIQILVDWLNINPANIFALTDPLTPKSNRTDQENVNVWHERRAVNRIAFNALESVAPRIAILDLQGQIVLVNQAWREMAFANSNDGGKHLCEGVNYLEVCDSITSFDKVYSQSIATGIRKVIANEKTHYSLKYPCYTPKEKIWYTVQVIAYDKESVRHVIVYHETFGELEE